MKRILYIGMDVHTSNFTFCALEPVLGGEDKIFGITKCNADYKNVLKYLETLKQNIGDDVEFICGYEAGCLGYTLYHQLMENGIQCVILAPTTMLTPKGTRMKTDSRDAKLIAQCLAYGTYSPVYIPTKQDDAVKEYIRMRDDHKNALKKVKQQIGAFCLRHGFEYSGKAKWTLVHIRWLRTLTMDDLLKKILIEYLGTYDYLDSKIEELDREIQKLSSEEKYKDDVKKLVCFLGIKTSTALALVAETGDFKRFKKGNIYAAYLGMTPGEDSSGDDVNRGGISKAGNSHLRRLLIEAAQGICKGHVGQKSKELKARQKGNTSEVIAYADKANIRLRRKYYRMINKGKKRNVAIAAIARELACFVWGMMTNNITEPV